MCLATTKQASEATGLSEWELRVGWKQGRYPAIEIGQGERAKRLRWNLDLLQQAIMDQMVSNQEQRRVYCEGR